jgi:pSer/pThr/pTyr-binding forkhead associated (FHA) protein
LVRYITENEDETVFEPSPNGFLVLMVGGRGSQVFPLRGTAHIGRDKSNSVVVADQKVSRHHVTLTPIDDTFILIDQGSANGTYLNAVLVSQPTRLKHHDRFTLGDTEFLFSTSAPTLDKLNDGQPMKIDPSRVVLAGTPILPTDNRPIWLLFGCMALLIFALLLALAMLFGLFIGAGLSI